MRPAFAETSRTGTTQARPPSSVWRSRRAAAGQTAQGRAGAAPSEHSRAAHRRRRARGAGPRTRRAGSGARGRRPAACRLPGRSRPGSRREGTGRRPDRPRSPWSAARTAGRAPPAPLAGTARTAPALTLPRSRPSASAATTPSASEAIASTATAGNVRRRFGMGRDLRRVWGSSSGEGCSEGLIGRSARLRRS